MALNIGLNRMASMIHILYYFPQNSSTHASERHLLLSSALPASFSTVGEDRYSGISLTSNIMLIQYNISEMSKLLSTHGE